MKEQLFSAIEDQRSRLTAMSDQIFDNPEYEGEEVVGFLFQGGGLGHGVGMSQNGANQMAKEGWNYSEILKFFYTGVDLTPVSALY